MAAITLYGLKTCDTCKKAMAALGDAGHAVTFVDIRSEADLAAKVPSWLEAAGPDTLVNRRSTTWRTLSDDQKAVADKGGAAELLIANATLIKRPVIEADGAIHIGWAKPVQTTLL